MATPAAIMSMAASLMNDTARTVYTDTAVLPYLNIALDDLQEIFEHNNIPVTNQVSSVLAIPAGVSAIGYATSPALPADLIEIEELWERETGTVQSWVPMTQVDFIPLYQEDQSISQFRIWAWVSQEIRLVAATNDNDLKMDYIRSIFATPILIANIAVDLGITNTKQYLGYHTAALCAQFVAENETRAGILEEQAQSALDRELGIPTKGRQSIHTRRRPFMSSYRRRYYV